MQEASDTCYNYCERYDPSVGAPDPFDVEVPGTETAACSLSISEFWVGSRPQTRKNVIQ
jgi:hypothetical protein